MNCLENERFKEKRNEEKEGKAIAKKGHNKKGDLY